MPPKLKRKREPKSKVKEREEQVDIPLTTVKYNANKDNQLVYPAPSRIPNAGNGLFAKQAIAKGSIICTYGGRLVDSCEAQYLDPTYTVAFELGRGFKLIGDNDDGDLGHFANAVQPNRASNQLTPGLDDGNNASNDTVDSDNNSQEAMKHTIVYKRRKTNTDSQSSSTSITTTIPSQQEQQQSPTELTQNARFCLRHKHVLSSHTRGRFHLIAVRDISAHEEVLVHYGDGYWHTMRRFWSCDCVLPSRPKCVVDREERSARRQQRQPLTSVK